jgi:hypothetical protein
MRVPRPHSEVPVDRHAGLLPERQRPLAPSFAEDHRDVETAVAYLGQHVGARRGHIGLEKVTGQGLLAVGFDHRQSRAGDPLLHTHLIVANRIQRPDGRWQSSVPEAWSKKACRVAPSLPGTVADATGTADSW